MFIPNTTGILKRRTAYNRNGEMVFSAGTRVPCGIVRLSRADEKTSVRADSSASRGNANELVMSNAKILFPAYVTIAIGDRFDIQGYALRVVTREPRLDVNGVLDHYECEFEAIDDGY